MTCWKIPAGKTPKTRENINFQLYLWSGIGGLGKSYIKESSFIVINKVG